MEIIFKTSLGIIAALFTLAHSSIALADDTLTRLSRTPLTIELAGFIIGVLIVLIFLERRASRKVRRAEATLRAIFEAEPECIKVTDKSGALVKMNPAGLAMIEADDAEQVIGNSVFGLVAAEDRSLFKSMHEQVLTGEPSVLRFRMQGLKGTRRLMESHSVRIRNPITDEPHVLAITRDITKRRLTEIAVERSNKLLDAIREAQEAVISDTAKDKVFNSLLGTCSSTRIANMALSVKYSMTPPGLPTSKPMPLPISPGMPNRGRCMINTSEAALNSGISIPCLAGYYAAARG